MKRDEGKISKKIGGAIIGFVIMFSAGTAAYATDFGKAGETFPIKEENLLEMIDRKLREAEADGRLADLQEQMVDQTKRKVERPTPVPGMSYATEYASFTYDPTVTAQQDYLDNQGNIVVAKGTTANPLDVSPMQTELLFIDGDRKVEVDWALSLHAELEGAVRIILVNGPPLELMREHKVRMYFDQNAFMSRTFDLVRTPSRITQDGRVLKIEEIPLESEG